MPNGRHSGESRNPVVSDSYENTGHRFSPVRRLFTRPSIVVYSINQGVMERTKSILDEKENRSLYRTEGKQEGDRFL